MLPNINPTPRGNPAATRARAVAAVLAVAATVLPGCKLPTVNLAADEPIAVDIKMRVDLYQHTGDGPDTTKESREAAEVVERQRNRMAEVQTLKNNRFVGENHRGLLNIRNLPAGDQGTYVKETVEAENEDRTYLMRQEAKRRETPLAEVQKEQWKARVRDAYKGEWVEVAADGPDQFRWVQKKSNAAVE